MLLQEKVMAIDWQVTFKAAFLGWAFGLEVKAQVRMQVSRVRIHGSS